MADRTEKIVNELLESYKKYDITGRIDAENMLGKNILIEIVEEIRKVLFPGFFDKNRVRSEYMLWVIRIYAVSAESPRSTRRPGR